MVAIDYVVFVGSDCVFCGVLRAGITVIIHHGVVLSVRKAFANIGGNGWTIIVDRSFLGQTDWAIIITIAIV